MLWFLCDMNDCTNHIWRISSLHCKSSVALLTVQTLFAEPVTSAVNPLWHGWWHKAILWIQHIAIMLLKENHCSPLFVASLTLFCGIFWKHRFAHYLLLMVHCSDFLLVWGLLRLAPNTVFIWIPYSEFFLGRKFSWISQINCHL